MIRGICKLAALLGASFFFAHSGHAHFYVDFSLDKVWLDRDCHVNVEVSNQGEGVPVHFYFSEAPVSIAITKGEHSEQPLSLTALDKRQHLVKQGGKVVVRSAEPYINNPKPVVVGFRFGEEYGDYNQRNNRLIQAMDCKPGEGQIAGEPVTYSQPDIAINEIKVNAQKCHIEVLLENKTRVPLDASAWGEQGIVLAQKNQKEGSILTKTLLRELDAKQTLNDSPMGITLKLAIPKTRDEHISVNAWYVPNDYDFHNNGLTYEPPKHCRQ